MRHEPTNGSFFYSIRNLAEFGRDRHLSHRDRSFFPCVICYLVGPVFPLVLLRHAGLLPSLLPVTYRDSEETNFTKKEKQKETKVELRVHEILTQRTRVACLRHCSAPAPDPVRSMLV